MRLRCRERTRGTPRGERQLDAAYPSPDAGVQVDGLRGRFNVKDHGVNVAGHEPQKIGTLHLLPVFLTEPPDTHARGPKLLHMAIDGSGLPILRHPDQLVLLAEGNQHGIERPGIDGLASDQDPRGVRPTNRLAQTGQTLIK